jgi:hypothetical protein
MVRAYVDGGGGHCPFCCRTDIEAGPVETEGDSVWGPVTCLVCRRDWLDVYRLAAVEVAAADGSLTTIEPEPANAGDGDERGPGPLSSTIDPTGV